MANAAYMNAFATNGNTALASTRTYTHLRVIEGGRSSRAANPVKRPRAQHTPEIQDYPSFSFGQKLFAAVVLVLLTIALAVVWFVGDAYASDSYTQQASQVAMEEIVVHQGDTLWGIASEHDIEGLDTSEVIRFIQVENGLEGSGIYAGQRLSVPQLG